MSEGQNVPAPTASFELFSHTQNCNFPEESLILSTFCNSVDSKESIPPAYVAWRAGTATLFLIGP